jgi:quinol---cytochrome c reductase cytochrome c subunit, bacillus type
VLVPYIDRNPSTVARQRKVAIVLFCGLLALALVLTVIGTFFRGPGWQFVAPWTHWYVDL